MEYLTVLASALVSILPLDQQSSVLFAYLLLGSLIGAIVGLLPGLGGATAMALLLPFTYGMEPTTALVFLLAVHSVTATTGDVTSVLFGVPGEPTSAALVIDGHSMTRQGEGTRAVTAALAASFVGAVFGALVLVVAIPLVKPLVLAVGSPEQFMLILLAITYLAAVSSGNLAKGLTMGAAGLWLSTIGLDPIEATPRYTFEWALGPANSLFLWDGLSIIIVTLGLFGVPAIVDMTASHRFPTALVQRQGIRLGFRDVVKNFGLVLRGSVIGAYVGLLPGVGGSLAQWLAYAHAARTGDSSNRRQFGHGAVEGVLAPASANNSKEGGSIVPTVAFGVPGSVSTTILLSALLLHGVTPGPGMVDPDHSLELTYVFVWVLVAANGGVLVFTMLAIKPMARVARVRSDALVPFLLIFIILGAYVYRGAVIDIGITLVFGLAGILMVRLDWPRPPLLLGILLGGIAERSFFISQNAYGFEWMLRSGVLIVAVLIIAGIAFPIVLSRFRHERGGRSP